MRRLPELDRTSALGLCENDFILVYILFSLGRFQVLRTRRSLKMRPARRDEYFYGQIGTRAVLLRGHYLLLPVMRCPIPASFVSGCYIVTAALKQKRGVKLRIPISSIYFQRGEVLVSRYVVSFCYEG